jgi:hypothetical protein
MLLWFRDALRGASSAHFSVDEEGGAQVGDLPGGDGVGLDQEVAVLHQLRHEDISEGGVVLGVELQESARIQQFDE